MDSFRSPKYPDLYYVTLTDHMHVSNVTCNNKISPILTYHPFNFKVRDVIRKNFYILKNDFDRNIFFRYPLISFRHSKNIREYTIQLPATTLRIRYPRMVRFLVGCSNVTPVSLQILLPPFRHQNLNTMLSTILRASIIACHENNALENCYCDKTGELIFYFISISCANLQCFIHVCRSNILVGSSLYIDISELSYDELNLVR